MPTPDDVSAAGASPEEPPRVPDVTVVVIAYNDAERLPTAVQSVLDQTLHNLDVVIVDDASTDQTGEIAQRLAEQNPGLVRVMTLPENSGGCSRPRNVGIEAARAPYVMFLDSDDTLERHAAKNLLLEAERTGADLVSGLCVRVNVSKDNRRSKWFARLYDDHRVVNGIREMPDLLFDTLCTNKLYRRDFLDANGIRFPEGLHYEDLLFTTEAYCSTERIALIPNEVYRWMVVEDADEASISNRRERLQNFADRITIHRRIDAYLRERGFDDLRVFKDRKFIHQDLKLYLQELGVRDEGYQRGGLDLAAGYLKEMHPESISRAGVLPGATAYLVREGDLAGALNAIEMWVRGRLAGSLTVRDGRAYLGTRHLDSDEGRQALDVTSLHLHTAPFSRRNLFNQLTSVDVDASRVRLGGEINDPLGDLSGAEPLTAALELRSGDGRIQHPLAPASLDVRTGHVAWSVEIPRTRRLPRLDARVAGWEMWMALHRGDSINLSQLTAPPRRFKTSIPWSARVVGAQLRLDTSPRHAVLGRFQYASRAGRLTSRGWRRVQRSGLYNDLRRALRWPASRTMKALVYRLLLSRLPLRRDSMMFESQLGRAFTDSPKYVYLALRAAGDQRRAVWSSAVGRAGFPDDAIVVPRDSWRYYYELARAQIWVDNQGLPWPARRRDGVTYLQTWHGSPYKAMGFDQPQLQFASQSEREKFLRDVSRWTHFCVQSPFAEQTFASAFRHRAISLRTGYPRNDPLLSADAAAVAKELRSRLELPDDRRIILYAPTFRDSRRITGGRNRLPFNLGRLGEEVGDSCYLLVRAHYLDRGQVPARHASFARDVSTYPDVTELLLLADGLITDYSSVMFDYALLRRPMLFFAYDLELYSLSRGEYFDLEEEAPGPVVRTEDEVAQWLADPLAAHADYAERHERFLQRFCTFETGAASRQALASILGTRE